MITIHQAAIYARRARIAAGLEVAVVAPKRPLRCGLCGELATTCTPTSPRCADCFESEPQDESESELPF